VRFFGFGDTRNKLVRIYGQGHLHFVGLFECRGAAANRAPSAKTTSSCYRRQKFLGRVGARNLFVKVLGTVRSRYRFALIGFVVMPEHVHLLIGEPKKGNPSKVIQALKQSVSRRLRSKSRRKSSPNQMRLGFAVGEAQPHLWQRRFYDFNVWSPKKKMEKLTYTHFNPVKRGLVKDPKDWPWSSYSFYEGRDDGLLKMDWE
jgi:putative transposase